VSIRHQTKYFISKIEMAAAAASSDPEWARVEELRRLRPGAAASSSPRDMTAEEIEARLGLGYMDEPMDKFTDAKSYYGDESNLNRTRMLAKKNLHRKIFKRKSKLTPEELEKINKVFSLPKRAASDGPYSVIEEITNGTAMLSPMRPENLGYFFTGMPGDFVLTNLLRTDEYKLLLDIATHTDYKELKKEVEDLKEIVKECCPEIYNRILMRSGLSDIPFSRFTGSTDVRGPPTEQLQRRIDSLRTSATSRKTKNRKQKLRNSRKKIIICHRN
jgi:hypothetical protein